MLCGSYCLESQRAGVTSVRSHEPVQVLIVYADASIIRGVVYTWRRRYRPLLIGDLDGGEAESTVRFGLDGTEYKT